LKEYKSIVAAINDSNQTKSFSREDVIKKISARKMPARQQPAQYQLRFAHQVRDEDLNADKRGILFRVN
jgi:hypothetical protein